jgi:pyruvate dehydrogenase E2 component (dihydrolipoamide acetyltransferase)
MRRAIAMAMARSKREIPHYYVRTTIDLSRALEWLEALNQRRPVTGRILPGAVLLKAVAKALTRVPELNGFFRDDHFEPSERIHVGMAVSLRTGGLVAPALHDVDRKSVPDLMGELADLVSRARTGRLKHSEMMDPTITVTSLGDRGVEEVLGIIYPPQVALVGLGKIVKRPWIVDGDAMAVRPVITASLSADHRVSDGHRGGLYLDALDKLLQVPEEL